MTATREALDPDALAALEEERDFLLRSLEDLEREHDAGDIDDVDYRELKDDYTARAATAIRAIDERKAVLSAPRPPRRMGVTLAVGVMVLGLLIGAGILVAASSGERRPGDEITGDIRETTINDLAQAREYFAQAINAPTGPERVDAYMKASDAYTAILEVQPDNAEALTYRGWLLHNLALEAAASLPDAAAEFDAEALRLLGEAIGVQPDYTDARIFRAIVLEGLGRPADALADLDALETGSIPAGMESMVGNLRARLEAQVNPAAGSGP
jgi:hypothetical protein